MPTHLSGSGTWAVLTLAADDFNELTTARVEAWLSAFVDAGEAKELVLKFGAAEVAGSLFAARGSVAAGDFGEILVAFILKELLPDFMLPLKWRWKPDPDKPVQGSDVVLLSPEGAQLDTVVVAEAKVRSTTSSDKQFEAAVKGATEDRDGRLSKTLVWFKHRYTKDGDPISRARVVAFLEPKAQDYASQHLAVVVVDSGLLPDPLDEPECFDGLIKAVVVADDLRDAYRSHYELLRGILVGMEEVQ